MIDTDDHDPHHGVATLDRHRSDVQVRRGSRMRLVGTGVLALFVIAGAVGLFGVRSSTSSAEANGLTLTVEHGAITRSGVSIPFRVGVEQAEPFDGPITIAASREVFDRFDFQNFYPNPSKETSDADWVVYEFDEPD